MLEAVHLSKVYRRPRPWFQRVGKDDDVTAVDGLSLHIAPGENAALIGESGSGKSTLARLLLGLEKPTSGRVRYQGIDYTNWGLADMRTIRSKLQMIFQNSYASFNPMFTVGQIIGEPLRNYDSYSPETRCIRIVETLELVGLGSTFVHRYPHELSGGQQQRVGIARAIALRPELIICDEPFSSLDVTLRKQMVSLLQELKTQLGLSYLFISHDLSLVQRFCDSVTVMHRGRIVERQSGKHMLEQPQHPYTRQLLAALPIQHPAQRKTIPGTGTQPITQQEQLRIEEPTV